MGRNAWGFYTEYDIEKVKPVYCGLIGLLIDATMTDESIIKHLSEELKVMDEESAKHTLMFVQNVRSKRRDNKCLK